jgi:prepilin-type N-terminal cleavage/methylation domain-containing protein
MLKKDTDGMTLIELMIVVAIIGVLAAVAIPRYANMMEKAREGATKGNIGAILSSVSIYVANNNGNEPDDISAASYKKYMDKLPSVKVTHPGGGKQLSGNCSDVEIINDNKGASNGNAWAWGKYKFNNNTDGWRYAPPTGGVWVNNGQTDSKGVDYTRYGYE